MKAQQLVQCMVSRTLFGGVWDTSKSVYLSDSQMLLSRLSVSGAYLKGVHKKINYSGYQLYCFQYVAAVFIYLLVSVVLFPVCSS